MMQRSITRRYKFCAAHFLPLVPDGHKCKNLHGHNYRVEVTITRPRRELDPAGFVIDFWDLDKVLSPILAVVDHTGKLNDIGGLENPTAEIIADWFFTMIKFALDTDEHSACFLKKVTVFEEDDCWASQEVLD